MTPPIPVAVVGAGRVARAVHLPLILLRPDLFRLTAVVETDPANAASFAAERPGIPVSSTVAAALDEGVRALVCATPWPSHRSVVTEALRHGVHVLTEKPVSLDPADLQALIEAERRSSGTVTVGYMKRHDPAAVRFIEAVAGRLERLRRISVDIVDPDSPRQVAHRLASPVEPSADTRAASQRAVRRLLDGADDSQRAVYARGLGGSLIHQINLVHAVLADSPYRLLGRLRYSTHWADGTAVSCGWWPAESFGVQLSHLRAPDAPGYLERIEAVADDRRFLLRAPSPYLLEQPMTFTEVGPNRVSEYTASPRQHGFARQLECWAAGIRGESVGLPGLAEALRDLLVVREAALASTGPAGARQPGLDGVLA
jgi:hypothetical protein